MPERAGTTYWKIFKVFLARMIFLICAVTLMFILVLLPEKQNVGNWMILI